MNDRIVSLERRRQELKAKIAEEISRPQPDDLALRRLKRENVRLKDEIAAMRGRADAASAA